jgi:hypothetical protein
MRSPALRVPGSAARLAAALALAVVTAGGTLAQQAPAQPPAQPQDPQQQPPPRIKTGINYVRVDVIVTDRQGKPVLDLKQDEFRLKEDGRAQEKGNLAPAGRVAKAPSSKAGPLAAAAAVVVIALGAGGYFLLKPKAPDVKPVDREGVGEGKRGNVGGDLARRGVM